MTARPLEGIRVADFGQFIAGPAVGQILADLGASVIKIEPVAGEPARAAGALGEAMVLTNNRDKRSLALDLRRGEGLDLALRLVSTCDVLIQNMRPGTMERLGLGTEAVLAVRPDIVYLSITAFGRHAAPHRAGLDIAAQAESGMMSLTGDADRDPQRVGFTVVDDATAYVASTAVLAALLRRERTGSGGVIDTSLLEVAIHVQGHSWIDMFRSGVEPTRKGNGYPTAAPAAEVIAVGGGQIVVSAYTQDHWRRLCDAIGRPELASDPRFATNAARLDNRDELCSLLSRALSGYGTEEAVEWLGSHGVVAGAIRSYRQVLESDDVRRLDAFPRTAAGATESYRYPAPPFSFRDIRRPQSRSAPALGEQTREILDELGYSRAEISDLLSAGVIADAAAAP